MQNEVTTQTSELQFIHELHAGSLPGDDRIELFADRHDPLRRVYFSQNGVTKPLGELPSKYKAQIFWQINKDEKASADLRELHLDDALQEYCFCVYGAADHNPDFSGEGKLMESDNFICGENCRCLAWNSKNITYNGKTITHRELQVINGLKSGLPEKAVAHTLGISQNTLDAHKSNLFKKFDAPSKTDLLMKATKQKIIQ